MKNPKVNAKRFNELLDKRKNLTATIFEEEELIEMAKYLTPEARSKIDPELLTYSNKSRLDSISEKLDKIAEILLGKASDRAEKAVDNILERTEKVVDDVLKKVSKNN